MTPPDSGAAGQDPDMGTGRAAGLAGAETSAEASALDQSDERHRCAAEENFKAAFGRYPQRVELPTPEAATDRLVNKLLTGRDDYKPNLKVIESDV